MSKLCLAVAEWPERDQGAWHAALLPGDFLEPGGPASRWRPGSQRIVSEGYGTWLAWLKNKGQLDCQASPGDRCEAGRLKQFAGEMMAQVSPSTVQIRLGALERAMSAIEPAFDRSSLKRLKSRLCPETGVSERKRLRVQDTLELERYGRQLMQRAASLCEPGDRAVLYRDGLIIALLASRPLRRKNLTALTIGVDFVRKAEGWWFDIPGKETKNRRAIHVAWPTALDDALTTWLEVYRPVLCGFGPGTMSTSTGPLWISAKGRPVSAHTLSVRISEHTARKFGAAVNIHLFRDSVATSIAINDPKHVGIIPAMLTHNSAKTAERYYNLAGSIQASASYLDALDNLRKR